MASYEIAWKSSAVRDLKGIDKQFIPRIIATVESLSDDPFPPQHRKLHGVDTSYRIRIGDYRVIYQVDLENGIIVIFHVRHRKEAYRS